MSRKAVQSVTIPTIFRSELGARGLEKKALEDIFAQADRSIAAGVNIIILSDRGRERPTEKAPIPPLLAVAGPSTII